MIQRLLLSIPLLLILGIYNAAYAQELPDLGDPFRDDFSLFQEQVVGASIMGKIRSSPTYVSDPEVIEYINHLGYRLVANSDSPGQDFQFFELSFIIGHIPGQVVKKKSAMYIFPS